MALTDLQKVRLKISDPPIAENLTLYGDGITTVFKMAHVNLANAQAFVPVGGTSWSATGAAVDPSGMFIFSNVISANSAFNVRYQHTNFSDDEIQEFLNEGGSVIGAALAAVQSLMFDGLKRARWMAADGSQYDDTSAQSALAKMHDTFEKQVEQEAITGGGFGSWSLNQGEW
jgi:hypothetical protein